VSCPGDTVRLSAGHFPEQVTIAKTLTVIGSAAGSFIDAPGTLPANGTIVGIQGNGTNVDMSRVTVAAPGASGCGSIDTGVLVHASANAVLHDMAVVDIRDNPLSGCQNGDAIGFGDGSTLGTGEVRNVTIMGYQKTGVLVDGSGSSANVHDN